MTLWTRRLGIVLFAACASGASGAGGARAQDPKKSGIELDVEVPPGTKGPVYASLDAAVGGKAAWAPDGLLLVEGANGHWRGHVDVPAGTTLRWKITRGDWSSVEKGPKGEEVKNRATEAGEGLTRVSVKVHHWADEGLAPGAAADAPAAISTSLVDLGTWRPKKLPSPRRVVVWLPPGYDAEASRRYPVVYVLDGQNQFEPKRSFLGIVWALDKAGEAHVASGREAFIAVAIDNTPERADEYLPSKDPKRGAGGRLEDFASFVFDELKPRVDERFKTRPGPDDTGILGSSFGGMAAFHLGWKHSDKVRRVGSVSPSLWWNKEETRALVLATKTRPPLRIWLDMGTAEGRDEDESRPYLEVSRGLRDALEKQGFKLDHDLRYVEDEGAVHNEGAWAKRLPAILRFLFP